MIALAADLRTAHMTAIGMALDGGALRLYSGPQPVAGAAIGGQTLLAQFSILAWAVDGDTLSLALGAGSGIADSTAVWGRVTGSGGGFVLDGDCGDVGSGALIQLRSTTIQTGASITVTSAAFTYA